jgi:hypothetical protein
MRGILFSDSVIDIQGPVASDDSKSERAIQGRRKNITVSFRLIVSRGKAGMIEERKGKAGRDTSDTGLQSKERT